MTTKKFVIKTVAKVIFLVMLSVIVMTFVESPTITNDIAMGQMENSDTLFLINEMYNKARPIIHWTYRVIVFIVGLTIGWDIYKLIKYKKEKKL